jgi:RNA polymerase II subunit A C-terminal domain phosphatase SSU72|tara:strand:- start:1357 stop:2187 length:831 start_codon:yes stop_codon:yes gene_type:complete
VIRDFNRLRARAIASRSTASRSTASRAPFRAFGARSLDARTRRVDVCGAESANRQRRVNDRRAATLRVARSRRAALDMSAERKRYAVVCAANFNRSMEAHKVLAERGLDVASFGAASRVKLPGASRDDPNVYDFDSITYEDIASDLERQPRETVENYEARGMFEMLRRNAKIKPAPQRWQTHSDRERFDVVVCFEERVFDLVMEDLRAKGGAREGVLVVNLDVRDSHDSSVDAAPRALRLCEALEASEDWESEVDEIMNAFEEAEGMRPLYGVCYY